MVGQHRCGPRFRSTARFRRSVRSRRPRSHRAAGCRTAKVKVAERGQSLADDLAPGRGRTRRAGPGGQVRIDANGAGAWTRRYMPSGNWRRFDLEYVEQPCATRRRAGRAAAPAGANGIDCADRGRRVDPAGRRSLPGAQSARPPTSPCSRCNRWAGSGPAWRSPSGSGCRWSCPARLETSIGIRAGLALAAALPELPYACGLNTVALLADDLVSEPLIAVDGVIEVGELAVDEVALDKHRPDSRVQRFWQARLVRTRRLAGWVNATAVRAGDHRGADQPRRDATSCSPLDRAARRWRTNASRPTGSDCSGCTSGSTSAPPASWRLGLAKGCRCAGRGADHVRNGGGQPPSRGARGLARPPAADRDHGEPAALDDQHRGQPDHRPRSAVRPARRGLRRTRPIRPLDPSDLALRDGPADDRRYGATDRDCPGPVQLNVEFSEPLIPAGFDRPPTSCPSLSITADRRGRTPIDTPAGPADGDHRR